MEKRRDAKIARSSSEAETSRLHARVEELRGLIDKLDDQLVRLLNERASHALGIGQLKHALGLESHQPAREIEVIDHARSTNGGPLDTGAITRLFERIIDEARRLERLAAKEHER